MVKLHLQFLLLAGLLTRHLDSEGSLEPEKKKKEKEVPRAEKERIQTKIKKPQKC